jgi:hypothetical protein
MADFTLLKFELNTGTNATPSGRRCRPAAPAPARSSVSRISARRAPRPRPPGRSRPARSLGTAGVDYLYVFTADTTSLGSLGTSSNTPIAFSNANYQHSRLNWDNTGTFASAPIITAYPTTAHGAITRGDGSLLGGHATDTGGTARSYLKCNAFGRVTSAGAVAAAPSNAPVVTDGTTGTVSPTAGANWLTNPQGLQGDNDFITAPFTPAATTADTWSLQLRLFMGANMTPGTLVPVWSARYTWT